MVVLSGIATELPFLDSLFRVQRIAPAVDVVNLHTYLETWHPDPIEKLPDYIEDAAEIIRDHGENEPLWMAEVGYSSVGPLPEVSEVYQSHWTSLVMTTTATWTFVASPVKASLRRTHLCGWPGACGADLSEWPRRALPQFAPWRARRNVVNSSRMKSKKDPRPIPSSSGTAPPPTREQIQALAHAIWTDRGCPQGGDVEIWLEAERELGAVPSTPPDRLAPEGESVDPDRSDAVRVDQELERIVGNPPPRSPTSL